MLALILTLATLVNQVQAAVVIVAWGLLLIDQKFLSEHVTLKTAQETLFNNDTNKSHGPPLLYCVIFFFVSVWLRDL